MKTQAFDRPSDTPSTGSGTDPIKRRRILAGASLAGAGVVAAQFLPGTEAAAPEAVAAATPADTAAGYRLTPHIRRYYETTKA